jgi:hypothetical protein
MSATSSGAEHSATSKTFDDVFRGELADIRDRHNRTRRPRIPDQTGDVAPTTALGLTGLACSGGGIRSASFCLGVLQGLQSKDVIRHMDYLSTVSGGGYIGTTLTIGMSSGERSSIQDGTFPFGRLDEERHETPEVHHLRDNSRYLLQNGLPSAATAFVIYLRGIIMNAVVLLPILLLAAAFLVSLNPDTMQLTTNEVFKLTGALGNTRVPYIVGATYFIAALLLLYAVVVSVVPIKPLKDRQGAARIAGWIFSTALLVIIIEFHTALLRLFFEAQGLIKYPEQAAPPAGAQVFKFIYDYAKTFVLLVAPLVIAALPFIKDLAAKAVEGDTGGWGDVVKRIASRVILIIAAAVVPVLLWLIMMQLAYWGTAVSTCPGDGQILACVRDQITNAWPHAPPALQGLFGQSHALRWLHGLFGDQAAFHRMVPAIYAAIALVMMALWPFLSVNSNSLHQLYRDRLGIAFLIKRRAVSGHADDEVDAADAFCLTDIKPSQAPYHLINTALNVPGSPFANRRGRNADFFLFSRRYIGSEATGYVETEKAEKAVDGLNIGTAMAISGAAAAPNMGMASIRPLSPTIAFLNVRLGRWVRHPRDIAGRMAWRAAQRAVEKSKMEEYHGESHLWRIPGPIHLLFEAFSKSGVGVRNGDSKKKRRGFVFLTDGGHIDNLGIYELLRRRCRLIISIDAEADPNFTGGSLVQVERFARIDFNAMIRMNWLPIGARSRAVTGEMEKNALKAENGPHVAIGLIDYPPAPGGTGEREKGVLIYIKASLSGDENDYVTAYKASYSRFPHESTADQLFSEEQFEAYRALGEHIARRFLDGRDPVTAFDDDRAELLEMIHAVIPAATLR